MKNEHSFSFLIGVYRPLVQCSLLLLLFTGVQTALAQGNQNLTGTWVTEAPVPYLVEYTEQHPQGETVEHESIQLLERSAMLEWTLEQRPDGLIVGTNNWSAHDENGAKVFEGTEALLGFFDGQSGMVSEPAGENKQTAQINFQFKRLGQNRIKGYAYSIGSPKLLAMSFELVRK